MSQASVGELLLRRIIPDDIDISEADFSKKGLRNVLRQVAEQHPDQYRDVLLNLMTLGKSAAYSTGMSVSLKGLLPSKAKEEVLAPLRRKIEQLKEMDLPDEKRNELIRNETKKYIKPLEDALMAEGAAEGNPLHEQVVSGARGKPGQFRSLRGADMLYEDHNGDEIPIPVLNSYADGIDPVEYWAGGYGARRGLVDVKFATADAGFMTKRLVNAAHRLSVTDEQSVESRLPVGYPTSADDHDNVGSVLAQPVADYPAGTVITASILKDIKRKHGDKRFVVHSPITSRTLNGGIDRLSAGVREKQKLAPIGDAIGVAAAQSVGEKVSQGMLSSKHKGGAAAGEASERSGFEYLNSLVEGPQRLQQAGVMSQIDGRVTDVEKLPQGGHMVHVGEQSFFVPQNREVVVKPNQELEAGDMLSDGIPHPRELVKYKGIGAARKQMTDILQEAFRNSGIGSNRRNTELLAAGLINHVKVTSLDGINGYVVDDVIPYSAAFGGNYRAREGTRREALAKAHGKYLEEPVLHYTPGTRITKGVMNDLKEFGISDVDLHDDEPDFEPQFVRGVENLTADEDWMTQLGGFYTGGAFVNSVQRGAESPMDSTSFYSTIGKGNSFGKKLDTEGKF